MKIGWLNPSIDSKNLGDFIIEDAVRHVIDDLKDDGDEVVGLPTQRPLTIAERRVASTCDVFLVGGTNLLNGNIPRYLQWKLDPHTYSIMREKVVLLGVGWWQYQHLNRLSSRIWSRLLAGGTHSVRDTYTTERLRTLGLSAINTGCPTMWGLPNEVRFDYTADTVVTTVTDYHPNVARDRQMLDSLKSEYSRVLLWPQGSGDHDYVKKLGAGVDLLDPTLDAFDSAVAAPATDYFGTRLHAGVRALQRGTRATIVAIDNRATEIARDTGLAVVTGTPTGSDIRSARIARSLHLRLPRHEISRWKSATRAQLASFR